ncbi:hypothetical protein I6N98_02590 [Spongiibacter nanhainus]|uniref:Uncharacterized protein n=1 Tax=Spongiibacter nanhainus TaxID=2794344 RepID=A0A7T4R1M0_9GAMM|nr:hypothetical protein [Spongiibacter nanhainus]QQD18775.1 hypothetical protein I6N98_02590 [Spongiibacter nanhainus]
MRIHSPLLLLISFAVITAPAWNEWIYSSSAAWYRPHILWMVGVAAVYFIQRQRRYDDF